ncbi:MAG: ABC transporter permease [Gemmatimonadaceae bacterium]|nr:ABC transporter permease [Gemmatimonadaceae bacterium]
MRLLQGALVVLAAASVAFVCVHLAPGDPATALGDGVPADVRERLRAVYRYDAPLAEQFVRWIGAYARGELGWSRSQNRPVLTVVLEATANSLMLVMPAFILSVAGGMLLGAWQAVHAGTRRDRWTSAATLSVYSIPEFWLAFMLVLVFSRYGGVLPTTGMTDDMYDYLTTGQRIKDRLKHMVLPVATIACIGIATFARFQRDSMRTMLEQPFVRTAHAAGIPQFRVWRDTWRAALLPVITVAGLLLPSYVTGVVVVEQVFSWHGIGQTMLMAIAARDEMLVAGCVVAGSCITVLGAMCADGLRQLADPRLRDAHTQNRNTVSTARSGLRA